MKTSIFLAISLFLSPSLFAQAKPAKPLKHAMPKVLRVALAPVTKPARTLKSTLGAIVFVFENGVDFVHMTLDVTDKGLIALGPVSILVPVEKVVAYVDKDVAYVDTATEHAQVYLFGTSN